MNVVFQPLVCLLENVYFYFLCNGFLAGSPPPVLRLCCSCVQTAIRARVPDGNELGPVHHLGAGYVAGATMVLATNPVWMIKTRMQLQDRNAKASGVRPYSGLIGVSHFSA